MKKRAIYLLIVLATLATVACRHLPKDTEGLTDSEKLEVLDFRLEKHPKDHAALSERAQVLFNLGHTREALADIERAVGLEPNNVDYRVQQADLYFANGKVEESYKALSKAEQLDPENLDVQLKMGEITFYARDYDRSMQSLTRVTEVEPDNRTALFMKAYIYKETGDTANAVTLMRRVCDLYPDYEPAFEELGVLYAVHSNPMAVEYLSTALNLEPNNTNAAYALAMYYQHNNDFDQAETLYRKILDVNENSTDAWHNLGYIELFHYRDYERAIEYMTKAIEADPNNLAAIVNRGCAFELAGQRDKARSDFETALAINSGYQPAIDGYNRVK